MKKYTSLTLLFFLAALSLPRSLFAAEIFFEQERIPGLQDQFKMGIFLKTEESLNAIEGIMRFPVDLLELQNIEDGGSIINFWLERPSAKGTGEIVFSGITPGGYTGDKGLMFSMTFLVKEEGTGTFEIRNARILRNDGRGTEARLQTFDAPFVVSQKTAGIPIPPLEIQDGAPPEPFVPEIARDASVFEGRWFVVFAAQDKHSGIDHYEVKESRQKLFAIFKGWLPAESPYVLQDQELRSYVFVKAVDKAGDQRVVKIAPHSPFPWYANYENWLIIILGMFAIIFVKKRL